MEYTYQRFGCTAHTEAAVKLGNGCEDGCSPECAEFIRGISDVFTLLYELMFTQSRYQNYTQGQSGQHIPLWELETYGVYGSLRYPSGCIQQPRFFQFLQELKYSIEHSPAGSEFNQHCTDLYNFIFQTLDNSQQQNFIDLGQFHELSCFNGSNMRDYNGKKIDQTHPFPNQLDLYFLKQIPSHIDYQWYKAAWSMLMNALNTPKIDLNASGWQWVSPLLQYNGDWFKDFSEFNDNEWLSSGCCLDRYDGNFSAGCDGSYFYSMTGTHASMGVMWSDSFSDKRSAYFNAPVLEPVDKIRDFIGQEKSHSDYNRDHNSHIEGCTPYEFEPSGGYLDCQYDRELSIGTDWKHWSAEGRSQATEQELSSYPTYSPLRKCLRDESGNLRNVGCFSSDSSTYKTLPPIRLVKENAFSLLYFWNAFLAGDNHMSYSYTPRYAHAFTQFLWNRQHYFKEYTGKVIGQCELYQEDGRWMLSGTQTAQETSESDFDWSPAENFSETAIVEQYTGNNKIGYANNCSFTDSTDRVQLGSTVLREYFGALSGGLSSGSIISIDTQYYPEQGASQEDIEEEEKEWREYIEQLVSIFPETAESKRRRARLELDEEYLSGLIPQCSAEISSLEETLSALNEELSALEGESWLLAWDEALYQTYGCEEGERHADRVGDFASFYPSDWDGEVPAPFEYFTSWSSRPYATTVYASGCGLEMHSMNEGYGCAGSRIMSEVYATWNSYKSQKSAEEQADMENMLQSIADNCYSDDVVGYISNSLATDIQQAFTVHGPVVDGQVDVSVWKNLAVSINSQLYSAALEIADTSQRALQSAKPDEYDEDEFNALLSRVDEDFRTRVQTAKQQIYDDTAASLLQEIAEAEDEIARLREELAELWFQYNIELERIGEIEEDDPPAPDDVDKLYKFTLDCRPPSEVQFSTQATLAMYSVMPDSTSRQFDKTGKDVGQEVSYDCICPQQRYPVGDKKDTQYMLPFRRWHFDNELSDYVHDYKVRVFDKSGHNAFDEFRNYMMMDLDYEVAATIGNASPENYFGTPPNDIHEYDIGQFKLSVDIGFSGFGIDTVSVSDNTLSVQVDGVVRECRELYFTTIAGGFFQTSEFQAETVLVHEAGAVWEPDSESEDYYKYITKYGHFPDWSPPEISGNVVISTGDCLLARVDYEDMRASM